MNQGGILKEAKEGRWLRDLRQEKKRRTNGRAGNEKR